MPVFSFPMKKTASTPRYRGRFAPSPTGPLHFGSLVAALGSYLDARANRGSWRVRIEDLDQTRTVTGTADEILRTLEQFGFEWDGTVLYQSQRSDLYAHHLNLLLQADLAYPCGCSRKEINLAASQGIEGAIYPGTCSRGLPPGRQARAIRLRTFDQATRFNDAVQGPQSQRLAQEIGDFVVRRADGFHAYQLAVVVDDALQGITRVVRGADLLLSTPRQIHLQQLLEFPAPAFAHLPLVVDRTGRKLSKQSGDAPVDARKPLPALLLALAHLGQPMPSEPPLGLDEFWEWAICHWSMAAVPKKLAALPPQLC